MTVRIEIPMTLPSAGNLHEHWRKRHQRIKAQRAATRLMLRTGYVFSKVAASVVPMTVTFTRVSPRKLDDDNLTFAFKGIRDEVAAYFGVNDNDPRIRWVYAQEKGEAMVRIEFEVEALKS